MPFTGALGTANSYLGNIVLGFSPAVAVVSYSSPLAIPGSPPLLGVPWTPSIIRQLPIFNQPPPPPPAVGQTAFFPVPSKAPPILGVPWIPTLKTPPATTLLAIPPPPPPVQPPQFLGRAGPPLLGVPWLPFIPPIPSGNVLINPPPPPTPPTGQTAYQPVYFAPGLPLPGVPWTGLFGALPPQNPPPGPKPPPPPVPSAAIQTPLLARVPDLETVHGQNRLRRHTEILSDLVNSLQTQGLLRQTGPASFTIQGQALTGAGPPTANTDSTMGAIVGSVYVDTTAQRVWICVSNAVGAALWRGPI